MPDRKFHINLVIDCDIILDEEVINRVDDEWRSQFYHLTSAHDIAGHIAYNLVVNNLRLSQLDGWADMKDLQAVIISDEVSELSSEEINSILGGKNEGKANDYSYR